MEQRYIIYGVEVVVTDVPDITEHEAANYVAYCNERVAEPLYKITVTGCDDGRVTLDYELAGPKFERIRRITGYLTGSIDSWNDSKRAEVKDRVVHGLGNATFDDTNENAYWGQYMND